MRKGCRERKSIRMAIDFGSLSQDRRLGRALRWPLRLIPRDLVVPVMQGPLRGWRWVVGSANHGCWLGSYEIAQHRAFAEEIRPGQVVYDLGANVGFYTLIAARRAGSTGRVVAFEPLERNLRYLRRHLAVNGVTNTTVVAAAVSGTAGVAGLDASRGPSMARLSRQRADSVEVVTLDHVARARRLPDPNVMKIDVEGGELDVLRGGEQLLRRARPTLFVSTHSTDLHRGCAAWLRDAGFVCEEASGDLLVARPPDSRA